MSVNGPTLMAAGVSILLYRAAALIVTSWRVLRGWVLALAGGELLLDIATLATSIRWGRSNDPDHRRLPLRLAAAATVVHAVRVLVFVLGRTRPFKDFDVRPEHRADHDQRWTRGQVSFASVMSILGLLGVLVVRRCLRRR